MPITDPGNARRRSASHSLTHQMERRPALGEIAPEKAEYGQQRRGDRGEGEASQDAIAGARERSPVGLNEGD